MTRYLTIASLVLLLACSGSTQTAISPGRGSGSTASPPGVLITQSYFGLTTLNSGDAKANQPVTTGAVRSWDVFGDWDFNWAGINTASGTYQWGTVGNTGTPLDWANSEHVTKGQDVVFELGGSPAWINANPAVPPTPTQFTTWVTNAADTVGSYVKYWEPWNEVNVTSTYDGTLASMCALQQAAYTTIKGIDPTAIVTSPSFTTPQSITIGTVNVTNFVSTCGTTYWDVLNLHAYDNSGPGQPTVEDMYNMYAAAKAVPGMNKPIIVTEGGWGFSNTPPTTGAPQVNYLIKWLAVGLMQNIGTSLWYALDNDNANGGLLATSPATLNAAGTAYGTFEGWVLGATVVGQGVDGNGTYHLDIMQAGAPQSVVWNSAGSFAYAVPGKSFTKNPSGTVTAVTGGSITATTTPLLVY